MDGTPYKLIDGVAIGSPLGHRLANVFLVYHEKNWLEHCPLEYRPFYHRRYVDDIFILFNSQEYLIYRHANISFTIENKKRQQNVLS